MMCNIKFICGCIAAIFCCNLQAVDNFNAENILISTPDNGIIKLDMQKEKSFIKIENHSEDPITVEADKYNLQSVEEIDPCVVIPSGKNAEIGIKKDHNAPNIKEDGKIVLRINKIRSNLDASKKKHAEYMTQDIPVQVSI